MKESFLILVLRVLILFTGLTIAHLGVFEIGRTVLKP